MVIVDSPLADELADIGAGAADESVPEPEIEPQPEPKREIEPEPEPEPEIEPEPEPEIEPEIEPESEPEIEPEPEPEIEPEPEPEIEPESEPEIEPEPVERPAPRPAAELRAVRKPESPRNSRASMPTCSRTCSMPQARSAFTTRASTSRSARSSFTSMNSSRRLRACASSCASSRSRPRRRSCTATRTRWWRRISIRWSWIVIRPSSSCRARSPSRRTTWRASRICCSSLTTEAESLLVQQSRVTAELQDGLMRTRMVPFERHVPRLTRLVRQVAQEAGKRAELVGRRRVRRTRSPGAREDAAAVRAHAAQCGRARHRGARRPPGQRQAGHRPNHDSPASRRGRNGHRRRRRRRRPRCRCDSPQGLRSSTCCNRTARSPTKRS